MQSRKSFPITASEFGLCRRLSSETRRRIGAAAVEFAIVLPVLVTILLGATDFGRVSYYSIAVTNAARCGAEFASMNPYNSSTQAAWTAGITRAVTDELSQSTAFDNSKVVVVVTSVTESGGLRRTSVQVTYPFTTVISWSAIPSTVTLQKTVVMRGIR